MIRELNHPGRLVGFIKLSTEYRKCDLIGYPAKGAEKVFDQAFSEDMIKKFYPVGF